MKKKKRFIDKITSKTFRKSVKAFIIWIVIFSLFIYVFIKFVYYVKENTPVVDSSKIGIKQEEKVLDTEKLRIEEIKKPAVGNVSIT